MKLKEITKKVFTPKVLGGATAVIAGVITVFDTLGNQKKERDFKLLQERVSKLENK